LKVKDIINKILAGAALCAMLAFPCGCGDEEPEPAPFPAAPQTSSADVSGADVSGSDIAGWFTSDSDVSGPVYAIFTNAEAVNQRDIDAYMATVDPESDVYETTREDAEYMFAHYRLTVSIDNVKIVENTGDTAVVRVTQTTLPVIIEPVSDSDISPSDVSATDISASDVSGSDVSASDAAPLSGKDLTAEFVPCVTELTHTMTLRDNRWYITSTVVEAYREISAQ